MRIRFRFYKGNLLQFVHEIQIKKFAYQSFFLKKIIEKRKGSQRGGGIGLTKQSIYIFWLVSYIFCDSRVEWWSEKRRFLPDMLYEQSLYRIIFQYPRLGNLKSR